MTTRKSKELGCSRLDDLTSSQSSLWIAPTFVLFLKSVQVSGNAGK